MSKEKEDTKTAILSAVEEKATTQPKTEPRTVAPQDSPKARDEKTRFMYLGPSIPNSWVTSHQIFIGTLAEVLESVSEELERFPQIKHLLVPTVRLAETMKRVKSTGNILNQYYKEMVFLLEKKEEK